MIQSFYDTKILIASARGEIVVEQFGTDGVISRKNIAPDTLINSITNSRIDDGTYHSGLLPSGCIASSFTKDTQTYFLRHPDLMADITYAGTEYLNFPLPRLVFGMTYRPKEQKVTKCKVFVVADEKFTSQSKLYHYPFSNVGVNGHICLGNNALPRYKRPEQLSTLPDYILRMPNNNDHYSTQHNQQGLQYRDLLERLKDKSPAYYYEHILVESGRTLGQFLEWS